jgi:hypothetical protein
MINVGIFVFGTNDKTASRSIIYLISSSVPRSNEFSEIDLSTTEEIIYNLQEVINGTLPMYEWGTNQLLITSYQTKTEISLQDRGNITINFDTIFAKEILEKWSAFQRKYQNNTYTKNAIEKAFAAAKQSTIKWYGEYIDYRYRLDESDNQTTYEVVLRLFEPDIDLTMEEYFSELVQ